MNPPFILRLTYPVCGLWLISRSGWLKFTLLVVDGINVSCGAHDCVCFVWKVL